MFDIRRPAKYSFAQHVKNDIRKNRSANIHNLYKKSW